jgi:hypothetical protein
MKSIRTWIFLLMGTPALLLTACAPQDDEKALQALVEQAAGLAEEHDIKGILELTTPDFKAQPHEVDRQEAKRVLFMVFRHYGALSVVYPRPRVDLEPKDGGPLVIVPFLIVKKNQTIPGLRELYDDPQRWLEKVSENADLYQFRLQVVKQKGNWLVKKAILERYTGTGFEQ